MKKFIRKMLHLDKLTSSRSLNMEIIKKDQDSERVMRRKEFAMSYYNKKIDDINSWALKKTEETNFYYQITEQNRMYLALLISHITSIKYEQVLGYFKELENDSELRSHFNKNLMSSKDLPDIQINYARRIGWYAFARAMKPKLIVETGVDLGVGACILCSALIKNKLEGFAGAYIGTDIRPEAGELLNGNFSAVGKIHYGDSIRTLQKLTNSIDLFINDSDHSADYEQLEYETIKPKLAAKSIILGDNSHATDRLARFSVANNRDFIFFAEKPEDHWYPGCGIGISFEKRMDL